MLLTEPDAPLSAARESNVSAAVSADGEGALTSRLLQSAIHALELYRIYLGKELGLYAALQYGIVEAHGGRIWGNSKVSRRTTFYVQIPAHGKSPTPAKKVADERRGIRGS